MQRSHASLLVCPECVADLTLRDVRSEQGGSILEAELWCMVCGITYPVRAGVPRFVPASNYASGFGLQWSLHARTQYDSHNGTKISERRFFEQTRWPRDLTGQTVLEVGSGSGRFTEQIAATGATVVSLEYSTAVDANFTSNGLRSNVLVVQADLYRMPFRPASFDRVVCIGVLQHTPDVRRSFFTLPTYLRPGGHLAIDVYRRPRGIRRLLNTRYWVRPLSRRVPPATLYRMTSRYVRIMWPIARALTRMGAVGRKISWALLIGSYHGMYELDDAEMREWAVLDTFDMLAPRYDQPQDLETVQTWFADAGLREIEVHYGYNGIEGRARR